jgi:hypothetical protein
VSLADYHQKSALAASQVLAGYDAERFEQQLSRATVGLSFTNETASTLEGNALLDMTVRLFARLYPRLSLKFPTAAAAHGARLSRLARAVNPAIEITREGRADTGVVVGGDGEEFDTPFFAGSAGWDALVSLSGAMPVGTSANPLGAGAAACLVAANVFRRVFLDDWERHADRDLIISTYSLTRSSTPEEVPNAGWRLDKSVALAGVGAIGMAAAWALARVPMQGTVHLVDPEDIELSNLQRYVQTTRRDVGRSKAVVAARAFRGSLRAQSCVCSWSTFASEGHYATDGVLVGVDSAQARREVQASLPRWIANGWTQPGDLGLSVHPTFGGDGACLACLYLPDAATKNEDELIADALGIPSRVVEVRTLLHLGTPVPSDLLELIAVGLGIPLTTIASFAGTPIRELYLNGVCGGALLPSYSDGQIRRELHVPLAHQSALAGLLLAATMARVAVGAMEPVTTATRLNVLRAITSDLTQRVRRRGDGRCLCDDSDFLQRYVKKYPS